MTITASDVVSDEDVRAIADKIRNQYTQVRRAFRADDQTGANSGTAGYPVKDSNLDGEAIEIGEGESYPRSGSSHSKVQAAFKKYGVEVTITDEAVEDSIVNVEMDNEEDLIRAEERRAETAAYNVLSSNTNSSGPVDVNNNSKIEQADLEKAKEIALSDELAMDELIVIGSANDYTDFVSMNGFTRASDLGDQVVEQGILPGGDLAGEGLMGVALDMPVYLENVGNFSSGEAYVVDTSNFGWESERMSLEVESYREDQKDQTVYKVRGRWDWVATNSTANIELDLT